MSRGRRSGTRSRRPRPPVPRRPRPPVPRRRPQVPRRRIPHPRVRHRPVPRRRIPIPGSGTVRFRTARFRTARSHTAWSRTARSRLARSHNMGFRASGHRHAGPHRSAFVPGAPTRVSPGLRRAAAVAADPGVSRRRRCSTRPTRRLAPRRSSTGWRSTGCRLQDTALPLPGARGAPPGPPAPSAPQNFASGPLPAPAAKTEPAAAAHRTCDHGKCKQDPPVPATAGHLGEQPRTPGTVCTDERGRYKQGTPGRHHQ